MKRWWAEFNKTADSITAGQWIIVCRIWGAVAIMLIAHNMIYNFPIIHFKIFGITELCRQTINVLLYCMCWALTFPVSLWMARVLSGLTRIDWPFVVFQIVVCFTLVALTGATRGIVQGAFFYNQYGLLKLQDVGNYAISYAFTGFMSYIVSLMLGYTFEYHRLFRDNAVRAAKLETQLVQSQLETLRAQLQPHFLFNTLNAIVTLMRKGETAPAIRMVGGLSDLLRQSLDTMAVQEVPLEQELAMVRKYLDIQQMRFGERLTVEYHIAPGAGQLMVPNMIMQPVVENAIRHGIGRRVESGTIIISATHDGRRLSLSLRDSGPGLNAHWQASTGIGLKNTVARLEKLYGLDASFDLRDGSGGGTEAVIDLPARERQVAVEG